MTLRTALRALGAAALSFAALAASARGGETSLLATDGTLYNVRSGLAADLAVTGPGINPTDNVIEWSSLTQDGKLAVGLVPNTTSSNVKTNLDLAYDAQSGSLVLLWREELSVLNVLHLGLFQAGAWKSLDLLPNLGIAHAYNPQMLLSHQTIHMIDGDGKDVWKTRSLLSVIWWEESHFVQARYAPVFLDEDTSAGDVTVYDLPTMVGSVGATSYGNVPLGAFMYPSLQLEGPGGGILASFADLSAGKQVVIRINYPSDLDTTGSKSWLRRRIPVVGVAFQAELAMQTPTTPQAAVATIIGPSYNPTLFWNDATAVKFLRYDSSAAKWSDLRTISLTDDMSRDRAIGLIRDMAAKN
jgi:hypothetical protein